MNLTNPRQLVSRALTTLLCLGVFQAGLQAADWPQWRYDGARSAASPEELPRTLNLAWKYKTPRPSPAFFGYRLLDDAPKPVVLGHTLFFGSNSDDSLAALDTATGALRWRFVADGPIRFAPIASQGKVWFGADDGRVYCLNAADGTEIWRFSAAPVERRLVGHDRMISAWPITGGPLLADGVIYFAAGNWPLEGVFVFALEAGTGKVKWICDDDALGLKSGEYKGQHQTLWGLVPFGHLVLAGDRLIIPNGEGSFAAVERATGRFSYLHHHDNQQGQNGGAQGPALAAADGFVFSSEGATSLAKPPQPKPHAVANDETCVYSARLFFKTPKSLYDGTFDQRGSDSLGQNSWNCLPVIDGKTLYWANLALDFGARSWQILPVGDNRYEYLLLPETWQIPSYVLRGASGVSTWPARIKAGGRLYGCDPANRLMSVDLPAPGAKPVLSWCANIEATSTAESFRTDLIAADGRLFATGPAGIIHCFSGEKTAAPVVHERKPVPLATPEAAMAKADRILKAADMSSGFTVVLGAGDLAEALAVQSGARTVILDPDAAKVAILRRKLDAAGLYGARATVHTGRFGSFAMPQYFAGLIVLADPAAAAALGEASFSAAALHALRPYGGALVFADKAAEAIKLVKDGLTIEEKDGLTILRRAGALPGAADWTTHRADAAGSCASRDGLVRAPLGVLWYGGKAGAPVAYGGKARPHRFYGNRGRVPLVCAGRLLYQDIGRINAVDAYTGALLWCADLPGEFKNRTENTPLPDLPWTADGNEVLVCQGNALTVLDARTGQAARFLDFKAALRTVHAAGDRLVLDAASTLVVADRVSGRELFRGAGGGKHALLRDFVLGPGTAFGLFGSADAAGQEADWKPKGGQRIAAFGLADGKVLWNVALSTPADSLTFAADAGFLLVNQPAAAPDKQGVTKLRTLAALRATDGSVIWQKEIAGNFSYTAIDGKPWLVVGTTLYVYQRENAESMFALDLATGKPKNRPDPLSGQPEPWTALPGQGSATACPNLMFRNYHHKAMPVCLDLAGDGGYGVIPGNRPGDARHLIPADGVVSIPLFGLRSGIVCGCNHPYYTPLALVHRPQNESWTSHSVRRDAKPHLVRRLGINFGAPGDRQEKDGALWLNVPQGEDHAKGEKWVERAPQATVRPETAAYFRHHSSWMKGGELPWVAASGVEGAASITVGDLLPGSYRVRLVFAEPGDIAAGGRVFDVSLQGKTIAAGLDVAAAAHGPRRTHIVEAKGVESRGTLTIGLEAKMGKTLLCGVELQWEGKEP